MEWKYAILITNLLLRAEGNNSAGGPVAQRSERKSYKLLVAGSIPARPILLKSQGEKNASYSGQIPGGENSI